MKNALLLSIVAGAAAGGVSAIATSLVFLDPLPRGTESISVASVETAPPASGPDADWKHELELLRTGDQMLAERLERLERQPAAEVARQPVEPTPDPAVARLEDQLRQLMSAVTTRDAPLPDALATGVRQVYTTIQEEEREERAARFAEIRTAEMNARMDRYTTELGLDAYQSTEMRAILLRESEKREEVMTDARENGTFMGLRDQMRDLRDATSTELEHVLTEEQLSKYEELDRGRFGFGGDFGGGGPGGFGGRRTESTPATPGGRQN